MRKHPLLAIVTTFVTATAPGVAHVARADTTFPSTTTVDTTPPSTTVDTSLQGDVTDATTTTVAADATTIPLTTASVGDVVVATTVHLGAFRVAHPRRRHRRRHRVAALMAARLPAKRPYVALGGAWLSLRQCESNDNYAVNTGNGYYGAYQFSRETWLAVGGSGLPSTATPAVQDTLAKALFARVGWRAWPHCSRAIGVA